MDLLILEVSVVLQEWLQVLKALESPDATNGSLHDILATISGLSEIFVQLREWGAGILP